MKISDGNSKLGDIPNVSLVPIKDCANCSFCKRKCYALKAYKAYPNVKRAWRENSADFRLAERGGGYNEIQRTVEAYLNKHKPKYFRIHVAGDFLSQDHLNFWRIIADRFPATSFLAFTKRHDLDYTGTWLTNFTVVLSMWPGMPEPTAKLPKAWYQDGTETRVPATAIECPGTCDTCGMCWQLPAIRSDVVFLAH